MNRFDRPYVANTSATAAPVEGEAAPPPKPAPVRTIGSKIPVNRRRR